MKALRNFVIFSVLVITSFKVIANSLDEYAKREVAFNIVENQVLMSCDMPQNAEQLWQASEVLDVTDRVIVVKTILTGCAVKSVVSHFHYIDPVSTGIVSVTMD